MCDIMIMYFKSVCPFRKKQTKNNTGISERNRTAETRSIYSNMNYYKHKFYRTSLLLYLYYQKEES